MSNSKLLLSFAKKKIFHIGICNLEMSNLLGVIEQVPVNGSGSKPVFTANVDHISVMQRDKRLEDAYRQAWCTTIDSGALYLYARAKGLDVPMRITGSDLAAELLPRLKPDVHRLAFLVANEEIARRLREFFACQRFTPESVLITVPDFGFEHDRACSLQLATAIREHNATHLFMGVGCPKSEIWVTEYGAELGDAYALCVGAALGYFVDYQIRAPRFMRAIGMEWLWRLMQEPRRLGQRYLVRSWVFFGAALRDAISGA